VITNISDEDTASISMVDDAVCSPEKLVTAYWTTCVMTQKRTK
jgi:hypothetical protein